MELSPTDRMYLVSLAEDLDQAERQGEEEDQPEGKRFITMSDILVRQISSRLREIAEV